MKRLIWILKNWRVIWSRAGLYSRVAAQSVTAKHVSLPHYVEFEVPGMVPPYDKMRLVIGGLTSCGTARMGASLDVYNEEWGGWNGGVIDYRDLAAIRDTINMHLALIDQLSPDEQYRMTLTAGQRRQGKSEPVSRHDAWPTLLDDKK